MEIRTGVPDTGELWRVFLTTGWNGEYGLLPEELKRAFDASWHVAAAYVDGELVGVGRIVSDECVHAMIYDLIVIPERQGIGVGGRLLEHLVDRCRGAGIRDIQLFCASGKRRFYENRGFAARSEDAPGMQYAGKTTS